MKAQQEPESTTTPSKLYSLNAIKENYIIISLCPPP